MVWMDPLQTVLVTGGSGYIASWIVHRLLEMNVPVRTTVRDPDDECRTRPLRDSMASTGGHLEIFKANLLEPGSFDTAMAGCGAVIHTASPFRMDPVNNPFDVLVRPALEGTRNVLESVNRTPSVQRVVLTSSVVAMIGDNRDAAGLPDGIVTDSMWNETSDLAHQPYAYSKTVAEKEAWRLADAQTRWDLVTIHPGFVIGPARTRRSDSTSIRTMIQLGNGTFRRGVPLLWMGVVDVRDAAQAHINAVLTENASGRYIVTARSVRFLDLVHHLLDSFGNRYPFPRSEVPKFLVWLMAPGVGLTRKYVRHNVGFPLAFDNSRSREELKIGYRAVRDSITEQFQQLLDDGLVDTPPSAKKHDQRNTAWH